MRQENEDLLEQIDSYAMDSLMLNDQIADLKNKNLDLGRSSREAEECAAQSELLFKNAIKHKDDEIENLKGQIRLVLFKDECILLMVIVSLLAHANFGPNYHLKTHPTLPNSLQMTP